MKLWNSGEVPGKTRATMSEEVYVAGVIHQGAILSQRTKTCRGHAKLFPGMYLIRWRWCKTHGIREADGSKITGEMKEDIRDHILKKWGIEVEN